MRQSLRYLRWIVLHKLYVFAGGIAVARTTSSVYERPFSYWLALLWRLATHDLSKLLPSEFGPYRRMFYPDETPVQWIDRMTKEIEITQERVVTLGDRSRPTGARQLAEASWGKEKSARKAAFDRAWLKHIHRNDHHWQYWLLQQDDGRKVALLPPTLAVDEMIADWLGAGSKISSYPTLTEVIALTIAWYTQNRDVMQLRAPVRDRVEETLLLLGQRYGLADLAVEHMMAAKEESAKRKQIVTVPR